MCDCEVFDIYLVITFLIWLMMFPMMLKDDYNALKGLRKQKWFKSYLDTIWVN